MLNDDDLTMELSSSNTTIFNYSSNEKVQRAFTNNNFSIANGVSHTINRYIEKEVSEELSDTENENKNPVIMYSKLE